MTTKKRIRMIAIVAVVLTGVVSSSCKKDDDEPQPQPTMIVGRTMDSTMVAYNESKSLDLYNGYQIDTTTNSYDPITGDPLYYINGVFVGMLDTTYITWNHVRGVMLAKANQILEQERDRTIRFFRDNGQHQLVGFPESEILKKIPEGLTSTQEKLEELNKLRQRLIDRPNSNIVAEVNLIFEEARASWQKASEEDLKARWLDM